jgi:hypothetical protein
MIPYVRMYTEMELPKANSHSIAPHCCLNCVCVLYSYIHVLFSRLDFFLSLWPACRPGDSCWRKFSSSHSFSINKPGMPLYTECIQRPIIGGPTPFSERGAIWKWLGIRTLLYYDYTWHVKIATQPARFPKCCQHVSSSFSFFPGGILHILDFRQKLQQFLFPSHTQHCSALRAVLIGESVTRSPRSYMPPGFSRLS